MLRIRINLIELPTHWLRVLPPLLLYINPGMLHIGTLFQLSVHVGPVFWRIVVDAANYSPGVHRVDAKRT